MKMGSLGKMYSAMGLVAWLVIGGIASAQNMATTEYNTPAQYYSYPAASIQPAPSYTVSPTPYYTGTIMPVATSTPSPTAGLLPQPTSNPGSCVNCDEGACYLNGALTADGICVAQEPAAECSWRVEYEILKVGATWCGPCRLLTAALDSGVTTKPSLLNGSISVTEIDYDDYDELSPDEKIALLGEDSSGNPPKPPLLPYIHIKRTVIVTDSVTGNILSSSEIIGTQSGLEGERHDEQSRRIELTIQEIYRKISVDYAEQEEIHSRCL